MLAVRIFGIIALAFLITLGLYACNQSCGIGHSASKVIEKEFYPEALLKKYEWFKNAAAACDEKIATISVLEARLQSIRETYGPMNTWPRDVRESYNLALGELAGVKAAYNQIAADYNAQMAKFNWRFTNIGDLPPGAVEALPRAFKTYQTA